MTILSLEPAKNACCGISLRTAVSLLASLDLVVGLIGLSVIVPRLFALGLGAIRFVDVTLSAGMTLVVLSGAAAALLGLNTNKWELIQSYASSRLVRIFISLMMSSIAIYFSGDIVSTAVDRLIDELNQQAKREARPLPDIDRDRMVSEMTTGFITATIFWELLTDAVSLYFAHITRSLALAIKAAEGAGRATEIRGTSAPLLFEGSPH